MQPADVRALARLISQLDNDPRAAWEYLAQLSVEQLQTRRIGFTGPPGAGKSTLVDQCIRGLRARGETVGVVAIDPSSPFTGGAVLGDRIRMQAHANDPGVFIRSLGSRGALGGLARATAAVVQAMAAHGLTTVLIETVGVGQSEFDIMSLADTTVVVLVPEAGDTVQTLKAGILEIADILIVNKADRPGAEQMAGALAGMVELARLTGGESHGMHDAHHRAVSASPGDDVAAPPASTHEHVAAQRTNQPQHHNDSQQSHAANAPWNIPVLTTIAVKGEGVDALLTTIDAHQQAAHHDARARHRAELARRALVLTLCEAHTREQVQTLLQRDPALMQQMRAAEAGSANPYAVAHALCAHIFTNPL